MIFRELVGSLLKSLNLKVFISFFIIVEIICGNVCVCVAFCNTERTHTAVKHTSLHRTHAHCSPTYLFTQNARTLQSNIPPHTMHAHCSPTYLSTQNARTLQSNIPLHTECTHTAVQHTSAHRTHAHCSPTYLSTHTHTKRYAAASPHSTFYILNMFLNWMALTRNIRAPWRSSE
jgi:hypothetical protein